MESAAASKRKNSSGRRVVLEMRSSPNELRPEMPSMEEGKGQRKPSVHEPTKNVLPKVATSWGRSE